jgi:hypothetical protein
MRSITDAPDRSRIADQVAAGTRAPAEGRSCRVTPAIACDAALDPWAATVRDLALVIAEGLAMAQPRSYGPQHRGARFDVDPDGDE